MNKPIVAIIQARMSSSRLPGKVLKPLAGKPILWHIVDRCKQSRLVSDIVVATSKERTDDEISGFCESYNINCHRGDLNNVLKRYVDILKKNKADYFIRITGDSPLICPEYIDKQIQAISYHKCDFVWDINMAPILFGQSAQSMESILKISRNTNNPDDLEHVGSRYLSENPDQFKIIGIKSPENYKKFDIRFSVDEKNDYEFMRIIYDQLYQGNPIPLSDVINLLTSKPSLLKINKNVEESNINKTILEKRKKWNKNLYVTIDWDLEL